MDDPTQSAEKGIKNLVDMGDIGRFNVKHTFMDGRYGSGINSFEELAGNPEILRKYLVEVNRRMFKGNVLPVTINGRETFQKWITQASKNPKKISLVDGDLREVQEDIAAQDGFREYLELVRTDPQEARKNSLFTTTKKFLLTEIILSMEGDKLVVKLERYAAKLRIGMNEQEVYHWDPFDRSVTEQTGNGNKIELNDEITAEEARRNLNQLIHHDEMTEHIELVDMTGTVQDLARWNTNEEIPKTPSEYVIAVHERIATRLNKVRLSAAKVVASLAKNPHIENINKAGKVYGHLMVAKGIINGIIHNDTTSLAVIGGRFGYDIATEVAITVGEKFFSTASKVGKAARVLSKVAGPIGCAIDVGLGAWAISKSVDRLKNADNKYDRDDAIADIVSGEKVPDTVRINSCSQKRELQIDAAGTARVLVEGDITGANELVQIVAHKAGQQHTTFELDTMRNKVSRLLVQIQLENDKRKLFVNELVRSPKDVNSFHVSLKGAGLNNVILKLTDNVRDDSAFISSPKINLIPPKQSLTSDMPVQLVFKRETLEPVAIHHVTDDRSSKQIVKGFEDLENLFQLQTTTNREVHGGKLKDTFIGTSKALSVVRLTAFSESDNTLIVKEDLPNSIESQTTFKIDLSENVMGLSTAGSTRQATIQGDYHHLLGRPKQPDTIVGGCMTKSIVGRGGSGKDTLDLIEFKANSSCEMGTLPNVEMYLGPYTKVDNQAEMGSFNYFVDLTQYAEYLSFAIRSTENTSNNIVFTLPSLEKSAILAIDSIKFEKERKSLTFTLRDRTTSLKVYEFQMYRKDESSEFSDPKFLFTTSEDKWVTSDVRVDKHGTVIATNVLAGDCSGAHQDTVVKGLPVNVNHFLVNMTGSGSDGSCGKVERHTDSAENHIWLYRLPDEQHFTIVGSDKYYFRDGNLATDTLHIDKDFYSDRPLEALFKKEQSGSLAVKGVLTVGLQFIDNFEGRNDPRSYDAVIPSCSLKQVSGVDLVSILLHPHADCIYNLIVQVEPMTRVEFEWVDKENGEGIKNLVDFWNSTFYYRFSEPMSFEVVQSYPGMLDGTVHNLYLPFLLGDLETMSFDVEESKLHYTFNSEEYSITMISEPDDEDQFYPQPNMVTSDGFRIQIGRDGSVLVTKFLNDEQPPALDLLSKFQAIANTLVITMLIQTNDTFLHIGNDGSTSDRNVLQNLASTVSYMAGGGADDIYEVVSLMKDVYISTGLENASLAPAVNEEGPYISKQTIDLTDIVVPIRFKVGMKYIPFVYQDRDDLIITMREFELDHPGKVVVLNGATESVRKNLQILLSNAMMEFIRIHEGIWILSPIDIHLERETIYSIAAEDLEPNHRIYVLDHKYGREYRFRFKYTKKENDIRLSDIEELRGHKYDRQHIEMTTVIITDFFKNSSPPNMISANGTYNAPTEIRNVTIFMPGLIISLDGTEVRDHHLYESDEEDMESPFQFSSPIATIPWDSRSLGIIGNPIL
ncbi:hypothetical protein Bhyg_09182 [Pseudolycoriella hygida]|uniref:Uncharacterized protein n=1 Tax=Pseudolycoriella hygida TaxID=35572 RepID=A0A9Q0S5J0_9DIPT|nr:hypothetical protein Bhyg_09182 [Pseudolycoriella hygida]